MCRALALGSLLLAGLAAARPPVPARGGDGHDLRGPGLSKGTVLVVKETMRLAGTLDLGAAGGVPMPTEMNHESGKEQRIELLAVEGRRVTKARVEWLKYDDKATVGGNNLDSKNPLAGRAAVFEWKAGKWSGAMEKPKASDFEGMLAAMNPWTPEDVYYPARRVKVGETWDVPEKELKGHLRATAKLDAATATAKMRLKGLEAVAGEQCAVIEGEVRMKGKMAAEGAGAEVEMTTKTVTWRSLRTGLDLKMKAEGDMTTKMTGAAEATMKGKMTHEATLTVEKKK